MMKTIYLTLVKDTSSLKGFPIGIRIEVDGLTFNKTLIRMDRIIASTSRSVCVEFSRTTLAISRYLREEYGCNIEIIFDIDINARERQKMSDILELMYNRDISREISFTPLYKKTKKRNVVMCKVNTLSFIKDKLVEKNLPYLVVDGTERLLVIKIMDFIRRGGYVLVRESEKVLNELALSNIKVILIEDSNVYSEILTSTSIRNIRVCNIDNFDKFLERNERR